MDPAARNFDALPLIGVANDAMVHVLGPGEYAWYKDASGKAELHEILDYFAGPGDKSDPLKGKYGYLEDTIWLAFRLDLPPGLNELVLAESYGVDHARFFVHDHKDMVSGPEESWTWLKAESGWAETAFPRALPLRQSNVKFNLGDSPVPRQVICLVALDSDTSMALGVEVGTPQAFLVREQPVLGLAGGFVVAMAFLLTICIIYTLRYRQGLFLVLAAYMIIAALMVMYNLGFANWLIWPGFPLMGRICATWCWGVACMLNVVFILGYLDLKNKSRSAYIVSLAYLGLWAVMSLLYLNLDERLAYQVSSRFSLGFPLFYFFFIFMAFRLKNPHAWLLTLFWAFLTAGILVVFLRNLGVIPEGSYIYLIIFASVAGQCLCFLLPLYLESRARQSHARSPDPDSPGSLAPSDQAGPGRTADRLFRD